MIIRIIATALVQCSTRTQAGWITLPGTVAVCWSLTVMLDMIWSISALRQEVSSTHTGHDGIVTAPHLISVLTAGLANHKKASRAAPARFARLVKDTRAPERDTQG